MKRKKIPHPLAKLRTICGLTQPQLAKLTGNSWRTIVAIEAGQRSLTRDFGLRLMIETGVLPHSLEPDKELKAINGLPYTREIYDSWRSSQRTASPAGGAKLNVIESEMLEKAVLHFEWFLRAAAKKSRLYAALFLFQLHDEEMIETLGLEEAVREIAQQRKKERYDDLSFFDYRGEGDHLTLIGRKTCASYGSNVSDVWIGRTGVKTRAKMTLVKRTAPARRSSRKSSRPSSV